MIATALEVPDDSSAFEMTRKLSREEVAAKLRDPALIEGLVSGVMQGVDDLQQRVAATGAELSKKFQMEGGQFEMAFGSLDLFFGGLEGVIGPPQMIEGSLHKAVRPTRHAVPHRAMRALGCEPWPQAQCTSGTAAAPPAMPPAIGWRLPPGATFLPHHSTARLFFTGGGDVASQMRAEHCDARDSKIKFVSSNGVTTTCAPEYEIRTSSRASRT